MSRKPLGLDTFDVVIHVFVTVCAAIMLAESAGSDDDVVVPLVFGTSAIVFAIRRKLALRRQPGLSTGEVEAERLAEIEARVADLEQVHYRVAELEERLDFSERLLAQQARGTEARVPGQELH